MIHTRLLDAEEYIVAADLLKKNELVVIPTETVYGLAANASSDEACQKIFLAKGRSQDNPLIVHCSDMEMIKSCMQDVNSKGSQLALQILESCGDGPVTVIVKSSGYVSKVARADGDTVALRIPHHPLCRDIIRAAGVALAAPSANRSGRPSPTNVMGAWEEMNGKVSAIVDGGVCEYGLESTIISCDAEVCTILREGSISKQELESKTGLQIISSTGQNKNKLTVPGSVHRHYTPDARVCLYEPQALSTAIEDLLVLAGFNRDLDIGTIRFGIIGLKGTNVLYKGRAILANECSLMRTMKDWDMLSKHVYEILAEADRLHLDIIFLPRPSQSESPALYDRLIRAEKR